MSVKMHSSGITRRISNHNHIGQKMACDTKKKHIIFPCTLVNLSKREKKIGSRSFYASVTCNASRRFVGNIYSVIGQSIFGDGKPDIHSRRRDVKTKVGVTFARI